MNFLRRNKSFVSFVVLLSFVFSFFAIPNYKKADAAIPVVDVANLTKEGGLDLVAWGLAQYAIERIAQGAINWINGSGGNSRYPRNLKGVLAQTADEVIGAYIYASDFGAVCDPFRLSIRASLARQYINQEPAQCTLSGVVNNVEGFLDGDFFDGGWGAWRELVTGSNPYTQFLEAKNELDIRIQTSQRDIGDDLLRGGGFLSYKTCPGEIYSCSYYEPEGLEYIVEETTRAECAVKLGQVLGCAQDEVVNTPGSVIQKGLTDVLGSGVAKLEAADEINEIIGALLTKLINNIFSQTGLSDTTISDREFTTRQNPRIEDFCIEHNLPLEACLGDGYNPDLIDPSSTASISHQTIDRLIIINGDISVIPNGDSIYLYIDGELIRTFNFNPWSYTTDALSDGEHDYHVEYVDYYTENTVTLGPVNFTIPSNETGGVTIEPEIPAPTTPGTCTPSGSPPNESAIVEQVAREYSSFLSNSCQPEGGTWQFMDKVVERLHEKDPRWGYNGKRGNINDPSHDAIAYYYGSGPSVNNGSTKVFIVDIISGHCPLPGNSASPGWLDVTQETINKGETGAYLWPRNGSSGGTVTVTGAGQSPTCTPGSNPTTPNRPRGERLPFEFFGQEKFLTLISYFDALRATDAVIDSDLAYFKSKGIDGVRIFANWHEFEPPGSYTPTTGQTYNINGDLIPEGMDKLKRILNKAESLGLVVELAFAGDTVINPNNRSDHLNNYPDKNRKAIRAVARDLLAYRNVIFDLQNEHDLDGRETYISLANAIALHDAVKTVDPNRVMVMSFTGAEKGESGAKADSDVIGLDAFAYHEDRNGSWFSRTGEVVRRVKGSNRPVYLNEPERNGPDRTFTGNEFLIAVEQAKSAGAVGWVFHNESSFDLSGGKSFQGNMMNEERDFINGLRGVLQSTPWGNTTSGIDSRTNIASIVSPLWMIPDGVRDFNRLLSFKD